MEKILEIFQKSTSNKKEDEDQEMKNNAISEVRNWYMDRYETLIIQRNILFILVLASVAIILASVFVVGQIASSKYIQPFVVEIEDKTGITNVVNPLTRTELTANETLNSYFIMKYLRSRETYDPNSYDYNYRTIVRIMSSPDVYSNFWSSLYSDPKNPITIYGTLNSTLMKVRSIQYLEPNKVQIRFTITEKLGAKNNYSKIVTLGFDYKIMDLTQEEREVNPLGFQITNYRCDDEIIS